MLCPVDLKDKVKDFLTFVIGPSRALWFDVQSTAINCWNITAALLCL